MSGRYRRGALAALFGVCCLTVALELPAFRPPTGGWRTDLLALGGVALVAGVLDVLLTPGDAVPGLVPAAMQAARSADVEARVGDAATPRYVAGDDGDDVRLVLGDETFAPVGGHLLAALERDPLDGATAPDAVVARLADVATGRFELAADVRPVETDADAAAAVVVREAVGDPTAVDAPVASLLAVGVARGHGSDEAVRVDAERDGEGRVRLTYRYE
ncbi:hypothetical protein J2752_000338 [Halarchaeum rubridurum]|uniref:DUF7982 domain-containing protein n=1 Tax=Halarchaeum rubridurum TaxID=489911 RepID=A0A830FY46_9EURY|nr:hypothetical protein [Halarchaeum rubridurum]MBP1953457.1 hypothetical protein [Halarchaeum rubridurum]GGM65126.1 hypothetical protein GCM10009017_14010 [Halarchaeum rubridurum]